MVISSDGKGPPCGTGFQHLQVIQKEAEGSILFPPKRYFKTLFYLELKEHYCLCPRLSLGPQHDKPGPPRPQEQLTSNQPIHLWASHIQSGVLGRPWFQALIPGAAQLQPLPLAPGR